MADKKDPALRRFLFDETVKSISNEEFERAWAEYRRQREEQEAVEQAKRVADRLGKKKP